MKIPFFLIFLENHGTLELRYRPKRRKTIGIKHRGTKGQRQMVCIAYATEVKYRIANSAQALS